MTSAQIDRIFDVMVESAEEIRAGLSARQLPDEENPSGEQQYAADVRADHLLEERLSAVEGVGTYASEERERLIDTGDGYSVTADPLDGSSNLESNNTVGTVLGVYDAPLPASGRDLVAAAYVLYGPITTMIEAIDGTVTEYVIEDGERFVRESGVTIPDEPTVYGPGGRASDWTPSFRSYVDEIENELKLRYGGSMVGDVSQVLSYGGIYSYPAFDSAPDGKLRLQFEGNPMAYVIESAGGRSSAGAGSILDVEPDSLHQRTPVHLGNAGLIDRLESALS